MVNEKGVKTYCYTHECELVKTGFHLEQYWVCKSCKKEVTDALKESIVERKKEKERDKLRDHNVFTEQMYLGWDHDDSGDDEGFK